MIFEENFIKELEEIIKNKDYDKIDIYIKTPQREKKKKLFIKSALMVSAHQVKHMNKLDELNADVAVINLEDGVSKELKPIALKMAALFLSNIKNQTLSLLLE